MEAISLFHITPAQAAIKQLATNCGMSSAACKQRSVMCFTSGGHQTIVDVTHHLPGVSHVQHIGMFYWVFLSWFQPYLCCVWCPAPTTTLMTSRMLLPHTSFLRYSKPKTSVCVLACMCFFVFYHSLLS